MQCHLLWKCRHFHTRRKFSETGRQVHLARKQCLTNRKKNIDTRLTKAWTAIDNLSIIWKSDLIDKMKRSFFQATVVSILLYGYTTWTLTKRLEKKLDGNYTRMLRAILNKSKRQHPTKQQLYVHLPPITKTIQVRRTRHAGHCWRSRDELVSDVLLWTPTHGRAKAGRPARTYIQQLCEDTGCSPEDLPQAMNDRDKWRERVRYIRAGGTTWWWWWDAMWTRRVIVQFPDTKPGDFAGHRFIRPGCLVQCLSYLPVGTNARWLGEPNFRSGDSRPRLPDTLAIREKFLQASGNYTVINCIYTFRVINIFGCFYGVMARFELLNHNFPN